jgi:large subunit ribosomal protein L4e
MTKVNIYALDGTVKEKIDLPKIFETPYRPDIIKKSFEVIHSNNRQPYGSDPLAGTRHAVASVGKGRGMSRVPRLTQGQAAALAPNVVSGRRAHPPKVERDWKEKMNKKENQLARNSALAATADREIVIKRGHRFDEKITLPIVVVYNFKRLKKPRKLLKSYRKSAYTLMSCGQLPENIYEQEKGKCEDGDIGYQNHYLLYLLNM